MNCIKFVRSKANRALMIVNIVLIGLFLSFSFLMLFYRLGAAIGEINSIKKMELSAVNAETGETVELKNAVIKFDGYADGRLSFTLTADAELNGRTYLKAVYDTWFGRNNNLLTEVKLNGETCEKEDEKYVLTASGECSLYATGSISIKLDAYRGYKGLAIGFTGVEAKYELSDAFKDSAEDAGNGAIRIQTKDSVGKYVPILKRKIGYKVYVAVTVLAAAYTVFNVVFQTVVRIVAGKQKKKLIAKGEADR